MKKIIVISASGMGCTVMFTPTLRVLRENIRDAQITFLGLNQSFVEPVAGSHLVDKMTVFDFAKNSLLQLGKLGSRLHSLRKLRQQKFDYSLTVFPSNKWYFNVFAWLVGAKKRITHSYSTSSCKTFAWLQNSKVLADPKLHDVDQNLNLLKKFGIDPKSITNKELYFEVGGANQETAREYIKHNCLPGKLLVGMHIGSSQDFAFASKRWPTERFAKLADRIQEKLNAQVLVFAGPQDRDEVTKMRDLMHTKTQIVQQSLKVTAALIGQCNLMISNDSGLMHIAVAMKTFVIAIFGPTSLSRTRPYTTSSEVIYDPNNHSLLKYPFITTSARIDPEKACACFSRLTVDKVYAVVIKNLDGKVPTQKS